MVDLGDISGSYIIGHQYIIFQKWSEETVTCQTYCTVGELGRNELKDFLNTFPKFKEGIINKFINNPFDKERDFFVEMC